MAFGSAVPRLGFVPAPRFTENDGVVPPAAPGAAAPGAAAPGAAAAGAGGVEGADVGRCAGRSEVVVGVGRSAGAAGAVAGACVCDCVRGGSAWSAFQSCWRLIRSASGSGDSNFQRSRSALKSLRARLGRACQSSRRSRNSARDWSAWKLNVDEFFLMSAISCCAQLAASGAPCTGSRRSRMSASSARWSA
ncbi:hypothetical protein DEJ00_14645 [Curtobacterium sp. MCLR17_039]|nr:hypothetical protein DEJ00_14645 [Curtobacterium sp. MCLR17_039]